MKIPATINGPSDPHNESRLTVVPPQSPPLLTKETLSSAIHDFNEPLRTITGYCDLILNSHPPDLPKKYLDWIKAIQASALRAERLADAVAEFAACELNEIAPRNINLEAILKSVRKEVESCFPDCVIEVDFVDARDLQIRSDSDFLFNALLQVFKNACVYSDSENPKVHISSRINAPDALTIHVKNNGAKIPEKFQNQVFRPFFRLHSYHNVPGHGLGLSLAKKIMEQLGGDIWLESSVEGETTFALTHPL